MNGRCFYCSKPVDPIEERDLVWARPDPKLGGGGYLLGAHRDCLPPREVRDLLPEWDESLEPDLFGRDVVDGKSIGVLWPLA